MSLLQRHLEQISLSAESIATLPFPPPKIFTNALLSARDITSLIRDTEPHERALFSVPAPPPSALSAASYAEPKPAPNRRQTVFNVAQGEVRASTAGPGSSRVPRNNRAVAAVLGPELHSEVRKTDGKTGDIDIEVLLRGVEKLNAVYAVPGVPERVHGLRSRYAMITGSLGHYERKVERQTRELERMNRGESWDEEEEEEEGEGSDGDGGYGKFEEGEVEISDEDLRREEEEIAELERKKRELEERVRGMDRALGGLLR